ncbi:MAG TPA: ChbG/HpnK family deacetylase [Mucilaginibacter sp.]|jgi:hypothetical protein|nr:ChbG/HpnK family deacetylase [Mucilaginibacter sp.]
MTKSMPLPVNVIANADDFGMNASVNKAVLYCFEQGIINSTSIMVNTAFFEEAAEMANKYEIITNVGVHVNLTDGKPITDFSRHTYLDDEGNWKKEKVNQKFKFLSTSSKSAFFEEINAQIAKALSHNLPITHLDSHRHVHTLPAYYQLFLQAAKDHKLKIRLAQSYFAGKKLNFFYRKRLNNIFSKGGDNYSDHFYDVYEFVKNGRFREDDNITEVMLHPWFDQAGELSDHYDPRGFQSWLSFLQNQQSK